MDDLDYVMRMCDAYAESLQQKKKIIEDLLGVLRDLDKRFRECSAMPLVLAYEAYDSFYQEIVAEAIAKATGVQP